MANDALDGAIRLTLFTFLGNLQREYPDGIPSAKIIEFSFNGERIRPLDPRKGIRKIKELSAALAFRTKYVRSVEQAPYDDHVGADGLLRYKWQGENGQHSDNRAMREAMVSKRPLAYFLGVGEGLYDAIFPVYVVAEEQEKQQFVVSFEYPLDAISNGATTAFARRYAHRSVQARLHQPLFRRRVLDAYRHACAVCRLAEQKLLDAAHIIGDTEVGGDPVIQNGMSLCKIHHAAFDQYIIGIRPHDLVVQVHPDVMLKHGGAMLEHGLKATRGQRLATPQNSSDWPDPDRLERRYRAFLARGGLDEP